MLRISIVGSGNVAHFFEKLIHSCDPNEIQITSTHNRRRQDIKSIELGISDPIPFDVDMILLCVSDDSIAEVSEKLTLTNPNTAVLHVSGSVFSTVLDKHQNHGVLYPLQTLRHSMEIDIPNVPFFITTQNGLVKEKLESFSKILSTKFTEIDDIRRQKLHMAAVIVNNFSNHIFRLTRDLMQQNDLDFNYLKPLLNETIRKVFEGDFTQTGPASRGDLKTIETHLRLLVDNDLLKDLYSQITENIIAYQQKPADGKI